MKQHCSICDSESPLYLCARDYNRKITDEIFHYYRCPKCGLVFIYPIPDDLNKFYPSDYYSVPASIEELSTRAKPEQYKVDLIKKHIKAGRLLEIGPACGNFAYLAKQAGFEVEAIEMDPKCCRFLAEVAGIRAINSNDAAAVLSRMDFYDVIALWHVIEHLPDPWKLLDSAAARLHPGGMLVIAAPNPDSWQFRIHRRFWPHVDAPRHLFLIPSSLLIRKINSLGLSVVMNTTRDEGSLGWNAFGWDRFFSNFSDNRFIKMGMSVAGKFFGTFAKPFESREGHGCAYTVIFRKDG